MWVLQAVKYIALSCDIPIITTNEDTHNITLPTLLLQMLTNAGTAVA